MLDAEGEPLRLGLEAEPCLVSPNQREAEHVVGQELDDEEDFLMALDEIAELGARNVHITLETGCFALFREERQVRRDRASRPRLEPVSVVGAGDVLLAQFIAAQLAGQAARGGAPARRRGRRGLDARGRAGRFDPREAGRLAPGVGSPSSSPVCRSDRRQLQLAAELRAGTSSFSRWTRSSAARASPSTTFCSCRPSPRCCRTTSRRRPD